MHFWEEVLLTYTTHSFPMQLDYRRMRFAYRVAGEATRKRASQNKTLYDRTVRENKLVVGGTVLVRNVNRQRQHNLAVSWEHDPYKVVSITYHGQSVFQVRRESDNGPIRNMLLPFTSIPVEDDAPTTVTSVVPVPRPRPGTSLRALIQKNDEECDSDTSSTSNSCVYVIPQICQHFPSSLPAADDRLFTRYTPMSHLSHTPVSSVLSCHFHMSHSTELSAYTPGSSMVSHTPVPFSRPRRDRRSPQGYGEWACKHQQTVEYYV